jgi:hypothetical protein
MKKTIRKVLREEQLSLFDDYEDTSYKICSHFKDEDQQNLCSNLNSLGKFLYSEDGLGLQRIIDFKTNQMKKLVDLNNQYQEPLAILWETGKYNQSGRYDYISKENDYYQNEAMKSVNRVYDDNGKWDSINKLNTNYSDLAELLTELFIRGNMVGTLKDKNALGLRKYLISIKDKLERVIDKYIKLDEFKSFVRNTKHLSKIGEKAENDVKNILTKAQIDTVYQGGDGDFVDMIFGVDLIVNSGGEVYTIQVKSNEIQAKESRGLKKYGKIDFTASPTDYGIIMFDIDNNELKFDKNGDEI